MKKIFYAAMAATMLFATSCSEALDDVQNTGKMATVSVNLDLPTIQTRAYSDGSKATQLQYAVYDKTSGALSILDNYTKTAKMEGGKATVNFQLVTGHTYGFVFWAANPQAPYTVKFDTDGASMTVTTANVTANDEKLDAFYAYEVIEVNGDFEANVKLYRPFAQLNIGTSDYAAAKANGYEPTQSAITVSGVYSSFNLVSGEVGDPQEVTYNFGNIQKGQTFPVEGYKYLSMAYILAAQDKEVVDVTFSYTDGESTAIESTVIEHPTIGSVPVQRNHRTNIFGQILTSNGELNVEIKPDFDDTDYNTEYPEGDGYTYDEKTSTYTVTTAKGLMAVYAKTLSKDYTVKLGADLDLNGSAKNPWTPLNNQSVTFDGQNHTITGLYVDQTNIGGANAGLFSTAIGTVKNLKIVNPIVKGNYKAGALAGDGLCAKIDSITVTGALIVSTPWEKTTGKYDDGNNVGGIVGYISAEPNASVTNCIVENSTIIANRKIGGIVGYANGANAVVTDNIVKNTKIIASNTNGYGQTGENVGEVVGGYASGATVDSNTNENVTIVENVAAAADDESLKAAIATENATVTVIAGDYGAFPGASVAEGVTIECEEGTVFEGISSLNIKGATVKGATFKYYAGNASSDAAIKGNINGNFEDCNFEGYNATRWAYIAGEEVNFKNCRFAGTAIYAFHIDSAAGSVTAPTVTFQECELDGFVAISGVNINYIFNDCVFTINASSKYGGGNFYSHTVFNNCKFHLPVPKKSFQYICLAKAGVLYEFNNCTNNGEPITYDFDFEATTGTIVKIDGGEERTL